MQLRLDEMGQAVQSRASSFRALPPSWPIPLKLICFLDLARADAAAASRLWQRS